MTTIIWALPLGYFLTNQTVTRRYGLGAAICIAIMVFSRRDGAGGKTAA